MDHPILKSKKAILLYVIIWGVLTTVSIFASHYQFPATWKLAIIDALVFNILYAILGLSAWYMVLYSYADRYGTLNLIVYHITVCAGITFIWVVGGYQIATVLNHDNAYYPFILRKALPPAIFTSIFLYALYILVYYLYIFYHNAEQRRKNEVLLLSKVKDAELKLLKSQINPHFLFNSLNSISSLTISNPQKAQEMIIKLSDFLRYSISQGQTQQSNLKLELENIQRYLDIEKVRFGSKLNYVTDIPLNCLQATLPIMILQPLYENAIKHGVYESTDTINLKISCILDGKLLYITISNNFDVDTPSRKGSGIGLKNIRERLKLIYHAEGLIKTLVSNNIFEVKLTIPQNL
jgi:hypothetical protein